MSSSSSVISQDFMFVSHHFRTPPTDQKINLDPHSEDCNRCFVASTTKYLLLAPFPDLKNPNCVILGFIHFLELMSAIWWQIQQDEADC
jgi:hypothetical protein